VQLRKEEAEDKADLARELDTEKRLGCLRGEGGSLTQRPPGRLLLQLGRAGLEEAARESPGAVPASVLEKAQITQESCRLSPMPGAKGR
jgi:hypothetical protein